MFFGFLAREREDDLRTSWRRAGIIEEERKQKGIPRWSWYHCAMAMLVFPLL